MSLSAKIEMISLHILPWISHAACRVDGKIGGYRNYTFGGGQGRKKTTRSMFFTKWRMQSNLALQNSGRAFARMVRIYSKVLAS